MPEIVQQRCDGPSCTVTNEGPVDTLPRTWRSVYAGGIHTDIVRFHTRACADAWQDANPDVFTEA